MLSGVRFLSEKDIKQKQDEDNEKKLKALENAERDAKRQKKEDERRVSSGEAAWISPAIESRLNSSSSSSQTRPPSTPLSSSSSAIQSDDIISSSLSTPSSSGPLKRDDWMLAPPKRASGASDSLFGASSKQPTPAPPLAKSKELNPYLNGEKSQSDDTFSTPSRPSSSSSSSSSSSAPNTDGGATWRAKILKRAQEQANEEGRSVDSVLSERYSPEEIDQVKRAAAAASGGDSGRRQGRFSDSDRKRDREGDRDRDRDRERDREYSRKSSGSASSSNLMKTPVSSSAAASSSSMSSSSSSLRWSDRKEPPKPLSAVKQPSQDQQQQPPSDFIAPKSVPQFSSGIPSTPVAEKRLDFSSSSSSSPISSAPQVVPPVAALAPVVAAPAVDLNKLAAQAMKAQMMGDTAKYDKIMAQIEDAKKDQQAQQAAAYAQRQREQQEKKQAEEEAAKAVAAAAAAPGGPVAGGKKVVVLEQLDSSGRLIMSTPSKSADEVSISARKAAKPVQGFSDGERVRYFGDDDKLSLNDMLSQAKSGKMEDMDVTFAKNISKNERFKGANVDDEYDNIQTEMYEEKKRRKNVEQQQQQERQRAINETKKITSILESCQFCFGSKSLKKHLLISLGEKTYLALPPQGSMVEGHCMLATCDHSVSANTFDEQTQDEIRRFRRGLGKMFASQGKTPLFFETVVNLKKQRHTVIECIPVPRTMALDAPMFFKEALMQSDEEWSQHKKIIDTRGKGIQRAIPPNFAYFHVEFGPEEGGYAHVIENEEEWNMLMGRQTIGGMLRLDPSAYMRPKKESFDAERKRVMSFLEKWKPFDWTQELEGGEVVAPSSSSSSSSSRDSRPSGSSSSSASASAKEEPIVWGGKGDEDMLGRSGAGRGVLGGMSGMSSSSYY